MSNQEYLTPLAGSDSEPEPNTEPTGEPEQGPEGQQPDRVPPDIQRLYDILDPKRLEMASRASGFKYVWDPHHQGVGYTDMRYKTIHMNPYYVIDQVEREGLADSAIRGFLWHEAGHHAPEVTLLQDMMGQDMGNESIVPEAYQKSPRLKEKFFTMLHSHIHNGIADVWLEAFMGRRPFAGVDNDITSLYGDMITKKRDFLKNMPLPEQLVQVMVGEARHPANLNQAERRALIQELVDPAVYEAYVRLEKAMSTLRERTAHEAYFSSPGEQKKEVLKKHEAYKRYFLPEWLRLIDKEIEQRGEPQEGGEGGEMSEEMKEAIAEAIADELIKNGQSRGGMAPSNEERQKDLDLMDRVRRKIKEAQDKKDGKQGEQQEQAEGEGGDKPKPKDKNPFDDMEDQIAQAKQKREESNRRGLAEELGVREQSVRDWEIIKKEYRDTINSIAAFLAPIFLDDRQLKMRYQVREGEVAPGLEYENIASILTGEIDPETKMRMVRNPEFLTTAIEFIVDVSGSMSGEKIRKSIELMVALIEGFKETKQVLEAEQLVGDDEEPFRIGVTKFSTNAERVTELDEPLSQAKEIITIDRVSQIGGGTDETEALSTVYEGMRLRDPNEIKIIVVLSDGAGNKAGVAPIIQQVEADDEVIFIVVGLGSEAGDVIDTYLSPLSGRDKNVFAVEATEPEMALPGLLEHLKREVRKHVNH